MSRSLVDRCHEVEQFLHEKRIARLLCARALLQADDREKLLCAIQFLQAELRMHKEVRTLWPYLLIIPDSKEAKLFCELYKCSLEEFGEVVQTRINQMQESLDVINDRMLRHNPPTFWMEMRNKLLQKITEEARYIVEEEGN